MEPEGSGQSQASSASLPIGTRNSSAHSPGPSSARRVLWEFDALLERRLQGVLQIQVIRRRGVVAVDADEAVEDAPAAVDEDDRMGQRAVPPLDGSAERLRDLIAGDQAPGIRRDRRGRRRRASRAHPTHGHERQWQPARGRRTLKIGYGRLTVVRIFAFLTPRAFIMFPAPGSLRSLRSGQGEDATTGVRRAWGYRRRGAIAAPKTPARYRA